MGRTRVGDAVRWTSCACGVAAAVYGVLAATAWLRYGHAARSGPDDADALLDRYMPAYDIVERHHIAVAADADLTFATASTMDLNQSWVVRAIFRTREIVLGAKPDTDARPRGLVALTRSLGWGVLADVPGRELVMGAVTQPWKANVIFRSLAPAEFAAFNDPGYVKIVWTLRADPVGAGQSIFRTETRAVATDAGARRRFRRYWSLLSPGIVAIRWMMLEPLRRAAEARAREVAPGAILPPPSVSVP